MEVTAYTNAARNQSLSFSREGGKQEVRETSGRHGGRLRFRFACRLLSHRRGNLAALILKSLASCRVRIALRRAWSCCPRQQPVEVLLSTVCLWVAAGNKITFALINLIFIHALWKTLCRRRRIPIFIKCRATLVRLVLVEGWQKNKINKNNS